MNRSMTEREYRPWIAMAMAAPLAEAASHSGWPVALLLALFCTLLCMGVAGIDVSRKLCLIQWCVIVMTTAEFLNWTYNCWPGRYTEYAVPATILILAVISACKGEEKAASAVNALRFGTFLVFSAVLLSGAGEMEWRNLKPDWKIDAGSIAAVLLIPAIGAPSAERKKLRWEIPVAAIAFSAITRGVMGRKADFYQLSRSISLLGAAERYESIVAAAMTISYYSLMTYLISMAGQAWKKWGGEQKTGVRLCALLAIGVYLTGLRLNAVAMAMLMMVTFVILPLLTELKNKCKKEEKSA